MRAFPMIRAAPLRSEGRVLSGLANRYLSSPFFTAKERISLDRNDFALPEDAEAGLEDGARTLAFVTAAAISKAQAHLRRNRNCGSCAAGAGTTG